MTTTPVARRCVTAPALACVLSLAACASVGPAPAVLSADLGTRIAEMRGLHQLALERFFDSERRRVEDFIDNEWTPLFLQNFLGTSQLLSEMARVGTVGEEDRARLRDALEEYLGDSSEAERAAAEVAAAVTERRSTEHAAVRTVLDRFVEDDRVDAATAHVLALLGSADPGLLVLEWARDAQTQINAQRREMLEPLNAAEREATAELTEAYAQMLNANGVITARLEAAAKVKEQQDALLAAVGAGESPDALRARLVSISDRVGNALAAADSVLESDGTAAAATLLRQALGGSNE